MPFCEVKLCPNSTRIVLPDGRKINPSYAVYTDVRGGTVGKRCELHALSGDIDIRKRSCVEVGCILYPIFSSSVGASRADKCSFHILPEDVCVVKKNNCQFFEDVTDMKTGCLSRPSHAPDGSKFAAWCSKHSEVFSSETVVRTSGKIGKCRHPEGCMVTASYGRPAIWCATHKPDGAPHR